MAKPVIPAVMQKFASTRIGSWCFARLLPQTDSIFLRLTFGKSTLTSFLAGLPVVYVTSLGAKSNQPRTNPLLPIYLPGTTDVFAIIGTNFGQNHFPGWYFNLRKTPEAKCRIRQQTKDYTAREAEGEEYNRFWDSALGVYAGYGNYRQRIKGRHIPIMVMTPKG